MAKKSPAQPIKRATTRAHAKRELQALQTAFERAASEFNAALRRNAKQRGYRHFPLTYCW